MRDLHRFREVVRTRRRWVGRSQRQLATALGLHPDVLSHKLNGHGQAMLTRPEVLGIVTTLADWGALPDDADVEELLAAAGIPGRLNGTASSPMWDAGRVVAGVPAIGWPAAAANQATIFAATEAAPLRLARLPAARNSLIGRQPERREVAAALTVSRLVTLTGVGGTGKTRLAVQVGEDIRHRFGDGVGFVDLGSVRDPTLFATAVAAECGLVPTAADGAEADLATAFAQRSLLLVVDNVEQVVEAADVLGRLLTAAPGLHILATSRTCLDLYAEHVVRVPPLRTDAAELSVDSEAVQLFLARARAARSDFSADPDDLPVISDICAALDGLPLAIELAASKMRTYRPRELLPELTSRVEFLHGGPRDVPRRHQALRATLDWSYALLPTAAQRLLACVSVFGGPFDVGAAAAVSGEPEAAILPTLSELVDQSMVEVTVAPEQSFTLLQTIREYGRARLAESGELDGAERRNLRHHLSRVQTLTSGSPGMESKRMLQQLTVLAPNIRVALEVATRKGRGDVPCLEDGLALVAAASPLWMKRGPLAEGLMMIDRLLGVPAQHPGVPPGIMAVAHAQKSVMACFAGEYESAADHGYRSVDLYREIGDQRGLARAYRCAGEARYSIGREEEAGALFDSSREAALRAGDRAAVASAANMLGQLRGHQRRWLEADALLRTAISAFLGSGLGSGLGSSLHSLGELECDVGHLEAAENLLGAALRIDAALGDVRAMAYVFEGLAGLATRTGAHGLALSRLGTAQQLRETIGARLAPIDRRRLDRITAASLAWSNSGQRSGARHGGRVLNSADAVEQVMRTAPPAVSRGSDEKFLAWIGDHIGV